QAASDCSGPAPALEDGPTGPQDTSPPEPFCGGSSNAPNYCKGKKIDFGKMCEGLRLYLDTIPVGTKFDTWKRDCKRWTEELVETYEDIAELQDELYELIEEEREYEAERREEERERRAARRRGEVYVEGTCATCAPGR